MSHRHYLVCIETLKGLSHEDKFLSKDSHLSSWMPWPSAEISIVRKCSITCLPFKCINGCVICEIHGEKLSARSQEKGLLSGGPVSMMSIYPNGHRLSLWHNHFSLGEYSDSFNRRRSSCQAPLALPIPWRRYKTGQNWKVLSLFVGCLAIPSWDEADCAVF